MTIEIIKLEKNGCMPCIALGYALNEAAEEIAELGATVTTINVSNTPEAIEEYGITSVPVLVFVRNGHEMGRITGNVNIEEVLETIDNINFTR